MDLIPWILSAIAITGAIFNANGKRISFWIWLGSNNGWMIYCLMQGFYAQVPMWAIYVTISIIGIVRWRQKGIK